MQKSSYQYVVGSQQEEKYPPFRSHEKNRVIYIRDILDNKESILSCLYALYALKLLHIELKRTVCIIFECNEESGFQDLENYL